MWICLRLPRDTRASASRVTGARRMGRLDKEALASRDSGRLRVVLRVIGFVFGLAFGFVGFTLWMLSNDGVGGETSMKLVGGGGLLLGVLFVGASILPYRPRS